MIKAIIFDFGGVVGNDVYWLWLKKHVPDLESKKDYFQKISVDIDKDAIPLSEFVKNLSRETGIKEEEVWPSFYKDLVINKELLGLIKKLKKNYKIGLLSNYTSKWLRKIIANYHLEEYFEEMLISSEHKMVKPDPRIYQKILGMLKLKPEEAIFIDDNQGHINGAEKLGVKGILFSSNQKLKEDLSRLIGPQVLE